MHSLLPTATLEFTLDELRRIVGWYDLPFDYDGDDPRDHDGIDGALQSRLYKALIRVRGDTSDAYTSEARNVSPRLMNMRKIRKQARGGHG